MSVFGLAQDLQNMAGSEGQESIIREHIGDFMQWASESLETDAVPDFDSMRGRLRMSESQFRATGRIWETGYLRTADAWEKGQRLLAAQAEDEAAESFEGRGRGGRDGERGGRGRERGNARGRAGSGVGKRTAVRAVARVAVRVVTRGLV